MSAQPIFPPWKGAPNGLAQDLRRRPCIPRNPLSAGGRGLSLVSGGPRGRLDGFRCSTGRPAGCNPEQLGRGPGSGWIHEQDLQRDTPVLRNRARHPARRAEHAAALCNRCLAAVSIEEDAFAGQKVLQLADGVPVQG